MAYSPGAEVELDPAFGHGHCGGGEAFVGFELAVHGYFDSSAPRSEQV